MDIGESVKRCLRGQLLLQETLEDSSTQQEDVQHLVLQTPAPSGYNKNNKRGKDSNWEILHLKARSHYTILGDFVAATTLQLFP